MPTYTTSSHLKDKDDVVFIFYPVPCILSKSRKYLNFYMSVLGEQISDIQYHKWNNKTERH